MRTSGSKYFGKDGPIARRLGSAYRERPEQQRLVDEILSLQPGDKAMIHGPVATGKNDALGVAALLSGHRTVLSTFTRTLLDSLTEAADQWRQDFPEKVIVTMKGRGNYVCVAKMAAMRDGLDHQTPAVRRRHLAIVRFGEANQLVAAPDAPQGVGQLAQHSCPGQTKCDFGHECHYYRERERCATADLVITTHAMVRAMCSYPRIDRETGEERFWFPTDQWIADEGDRLVDAAVEDNEISGRAISAVMADPLVTAEVREQIEKLITFAHDRCVGAYGSENIDPRKWQAFAQKTVPLIQHSITRYPIQDPEADEPASLTGLKRLSTFLSSMIGDVTRGYAMAVRTPSYRHDPALRRYLSCTLRSRPITVNNAILNQVNVFRRFAAVSGSLALPTPAGQSFQFHEFLMRIQHNRELVLKSPIDYSAGLRVVHEPPPKHFSREEAQQAFAELALRLHREAGNSIILCTSYSTIAAVAEEFRDHGLGHELLVQSGDGVDTVNSLALQLRAGKRASICATISGWVGLDVDARFKACVAVEKVPVPSVSQDLALHGRILRDGENRAYTFYGVPQALKLALQGCGRSLRRETDRCLLVVCDRRFSHDEYSRAIPGGAAVTLAEGIEWVRGELGAPSISSLPPAEVATDSFSEFLDSV